MPVYQLLKMPYEELLGWYAYFERRPVDWRADDRAMKLLQAQGVKEQPGKLFASLDRIYKSKPENDDKGLKNSLFFHKILTAQGGDK
jgi:hypothetical protein